MLGGWLLNADALVFSGIGVLICTRGNSPSCLGTEKLVRTELAIGTPASWTLVEVGCSMEYEGASAVLALEVDATLSFVLPCDVDHPTTEVGLRKGTSREF